MFKRLLKSSPPAAPQGSIPPGLRLYAIGDIHGRIDLLDALLDRITQDDAKRDGAEPQLILPQLIFLGDLVDRGPDSASVIERAMAIKRDLPSTRLLMGNHEEVFLKCLEGDERALQFFCKIGGRETILSYGISEADYNGLEYPELLARLQAAVPASHVAFLTDFEDMIIIGDYVFVHAGIRPGIPLSEQRTSDLRWIRESFLDHNAPFEKIVVHGHTISDQIEIRSNRIGIDTGAYLTGRLSAIALQGHERWQIHVELSRDR